LTNCAWRRHTGLRKSKYAQKSGKIPTVHIHSGRQKLNFELAHSDSKLAQAPHHAGLCPSAEIRRRGCLLQCRRQLGPLDDSEERFPELCDQRIPISQTQTLLARHHPIYPSLFTGAGRIKKQNAR